MSSLEVFCQYMVIRAWFVPLVGVPFSCRLFVFCRYYNYILTTKT